MEFLWLEAYIRPMKKETIMHRLWKKLTIRSALNTEDNLYRLDPMAHPAISAMNQRELADLPAMRYRLDRQ